GKGGQTPPFHRLKEVALAVAVHAALGEREEACAAAEEAIAILEAVEEQSGLASGRIHEGSILARELEKVGEWKLAGRVYDLVAAAVMIRFRQLEACTRELPELGIDDDDSRAVLARFRRQFVREQRELLRHVAGILEARGDDYVQSLLDRSGPEGFVAICAWCESVRPTEGSWLPIGHFVPREAGFQVTHAICPPCAQAMEASPA
ncbi:MAG: hypothetical protein P1V36_11545, partial [Planctomycetota bacterium]|nr:hypothetical protein [Planctomycetota bacterium]